MGYFFGPSLEERMKLCDAGPDLIELMDYLKMKKKQKVRFLKLFHSVDKDSSGQISLPEFFTHLRLDHSKFVERSFRQMDINTEGDSNMNLDVCEFFIGLFNFCFMDQTFLSRYLFDLYDDDKDGGITQKELEIMISDVCAGDTSALVEKLMRLLDGDNSLDVSFTEFMKVEKKAGTVLKPCFILQHKLQERCMGKRYWRKNRKRIKKMLAADNCETLVDYFANRVEKDMPPPLEIDEDDPDLIDSDEESDEDEETWEQIEARRLKEAEQARENEYMQMDVFSNEFEEWRKMVEPASGRNYWVETTTKEELWEIPVPGRTIKVGRYVRALDFQYERAYWFEEITRERFWTRPQEGNELSKGKKTMTASAILLRRERGFPDPPLHVSAVGGLRRAIVWWERPLVNERFPITTIYVNRYRLDQKKDGKGGKEWVLKGHEKLEPDELDGSLPLQVAIDNLKEYSIYKFSVSTENNIGQSVESEFSNQVKIVTPCPEGWIEYQLTDEKSFYANAKTKMVRWTRPEADPFFLPTELFMKFSRREIKKLKRVYSEYDWDESQKISVEEFREILPEIGELKLVEDEKKFKMVWKLTDKDEFGEISFEAMVKILDWWKEWKKAQRGFCAKYFCCLCIACWNRSYRRKISASSMIGLGGKNSAGKKLGDWQKFVHPMVQRPYYHNVKTKITTWEMPSEIKFYLPDKLNNDLRRRYDKEQMETFQKEFQAMDLDGSGAVDESELGLILENLGENVSASRLKGLIREIDKDGSGEVEYDEFITMLDSVYRGKGTFGWSRVSDSVEENKAKMEKMKDNLEAYQEEYEEKQLEEARQKGKKFPHGKFCYCGCRVQLRPGQVIKYKAKNLG